jgi:hypothetical protein
VVGVLLTEHPYHDIDDGYITAKKVMISLAYIGFHP